MRQNPRIVQKILLILALLGLVIGFGTLGYCWIEGWNWFDGLYMTIITLATIGYGETHPLNLHGRIFTMVLILLGSGVMVYAISTVTAFVVEGDLREALRRRRMEQIIHRLSDHFVICGAGQTGMYVVEELHKIGRSFIVIENDPGKIQTLKNRGIPCLLGDATHDETLQQAGVGRALGLISTLHTDAENLFVVLTAKAIQPQLRIIAKATEETSRAKLRQVGADSVVMPNAIGGMRMVSEMVRPNVVGFLDGMLRSDQGVIRVEEISMPDPTPWQGVELGETGILTQGGVSLVAIRHQGETQYQFNPRPSLRLHAGDVLILIGDPLRIQPLEEHLRGPV